jgi:hypothetical protein
MLTVPPDQSPIRVVLADIVQQTSGKVMSVLGGANTPPRFHPRKVCCIIINMQRNSVFCGIGPRRRVARGSLLGLVAGLVADALDDVVVRFGDHRVDWAPSLAGPHLGGGVSALNDA